MPPAALTTTSFAPVVPAGTVIVTEVDVLATTVAPTPPTVTEVTLDNVVPVITVLMPPAVVAEVTDSEVMVVVLALACEIASDEKHNIKSTNTAFKGDLFGVSL